MSVTHKEIKWCGPFSSFKFILFFLLLGHIGYVRDFLLNLCSAITLVRTPGTIFGAQNGTRGLSNTRGFLYLL